MSVVVTSFSGLVSTHWRRRFFRALGGSENFDIVRFPLEVDIINFTIQSVLAKAIYALQLDS